jgi:hypothetical protein
VTLADVPVGCWVAMTNSAGATYLVQRLDTTYWHVEGDVTLHTDDLLDVQEWQILDDDPYLTVTTEDLDPASVTDVFGEDPYHQR